MKKLTIQEVFNLLEMASAVILDEDVLVYAALAELTGEPENEIACFDGGAGRVILTEESCACATISDSGTLTVQDSEGMFITITLLVPYEPPK